MSEPTRLSRQLAEHELPEVDENMPESPRVSRRPPSSRPPATGSEERAGTEYEAALPEAGSVPTLPPREPAPPGS
jgi:hypothetical protein